MEGKVLDKYQKHCLIKPQKFSKREKKILERVFQRAMKKMQEQRLAELFGGAR